MSISQPSPESEAAFRSICFGASSVSGELSVVQTSAAWPQRSYSPLFDPKTIRNREKHALNKEHKWSHVVSLLWERSERILSVLRTKGMIDPDEGRTQEALSSFVKSVQIDGFSESDLESAPLSPNHYYQFNFGELVLRYGFPFDRTITKPVRRGVWGHVYEDDANLPQQERITGINTEFFAALLGGDRRLGHELVYYAPECCFYFFDLVVGYFVPTTEDKLQVLLSMILRERSAGQELEVAKLILDKFRTKAVFTDIIAKAKALLAADAGFFTGPDAKPRWGAGQESAFKAASASPALDFVREWVEPSDDSILTAAAVLEHFRHHTGQSGGTNAGLKAQLDQAMKAIHGRSLRNDMVQQDGTCVASWKGLGLRLPPNSADDLGHSSQLRQSSGASAPSGPPVSSGQFVEEVAGPT